MLEPFGRIAVGTRLSRCPYPEFFKSWTALIAGGLRRGDRVLEPVQDLPPHKAANKAARRFLDHGDCDTLLLIDDDMTFPKDALSQMRSKTANLHYDIVMAFCTTRRLPNLPIIMRRQAKQPEEPYSLQGDMHEYIQDFDPEATIGVDTVGMAFTLIRRRVFEVLMNEWGAEVSYWFEYGRGLESEDLPFCRKAQAAGFKIAVDASTRVQHIAKIPIGYKEFVSWYYRQSGNAEDK